MTHRTLTIILFMLFSVATCFGQTTFMGLRPGKSTRAEAEQVLGLPVNKVSTTLAEYKERTLKLTHAKVTLNSGKIFVQYRDDGSATVERIELILCAPSADIKRECNVYAMQKEYDPSVPDSDEVRLAGGTLDAVQVITDHNRYEATWYFGPPRYMIRTDINKYSDAGSYSEVRWAFYSKELYEAVAPKGNCIGMLRGEWETNRGRMTITRVDEFGHVRGTYSVNNGTFTGETSGGMGLSGEWKDNTGSGRMVLGHMFGDKEFKGTWKRTSGSGPQEGVWEGRCVEVKGSGND